MHDSHDANTPPERGTTSARGRPATRGPARARRETATPTLRAREPFLPLTFATLAGPLLWTLHFAFVFLLEGFLCAPPVPAAAAIPTTIIVATLVGGGLCAACLFAGDAWLRRAGASRVESHAFLRAAQRMLAGLSLIAILWSGTGALMLGPCVFAY